jgi:hypothetical protein
MHAERVSLIALVDHQMNARQPFGVIELSEQTIIDQLVDRLTQRFPAVPGDKVAEIVNARYARFKDRPIRDYIPLFVERGARTDLARMSG